MTTNTTTPTMNNTPNTPPPEPSTNTKQDRSSGWIYWVTFVLVYALCVYLFESPVTYLTFIATMGTMIGTIIFIKLLSKLLVLRKKHQKSKQ